jgi:type IV secretory pathway TraG/TraD family ATPase VirD4
MSTSIKKLSPIETLFKRPTIALAFILGVLVIVISPFYNTVMVLAAVPIYWLMYQCRRSIYKMGLERYSFLIGLVYLCFFISFFVSWKYQDTGLIDQLRSIDIWGFVTKSAYQDSVLTYFHDNLDDLIHWKMIVFSPAIAVCFYLLCVELDRKTVRDSDLQNLGLSIPEVLHSGSDIAGVFGLVIFVVTAFLFGWQILGLAFLLISLYFYLQFNLYLLGVAVLGLLIVVFGWAHFSYIVVLSIPQQFFSFMSHYVSDHGWWKFIKVYPDWATGARNSYGQMYFLLPWIIISGIQRVVYLRNWKDIAEVASDQQQQAEIDTTVDAVDFGYEIVGHKPVRITHKELNTHMYINGASGSGKTIAMLNFVIEAAAKGLPMIYIDGKGATDLEEKIRGIAAKYGRVCKVFTLSPGQVLASPYDFLGAGTFTEKKNRIMQLFITADAAGTAYYQDTMETFINRVFLVINQHGLKVDLFRFLTLISNINDLVELAAKDIELADGSRINLKDYFEGIRDMKPDQSPRTRIITKLDPFIHSSYGHLFNVIDKEKVINIKQSVLNGEIVLFLFDASAFALDTERVAKMVISDLNATFAELGRENNPVKTFCIFDEFKSYQTDAISKTISLHRSNGMHAIIGTQSLAVIDREIAGEILSNCQTRLVMASSDEDATLFSEEFGTYKKVEHSTRIKADKQEVTDITARQVDDYSVPKQAIKDLKVNKGHGYLQRKVVNSKIVKIQVTKKV